jgi:hypothetical protein
VSAVPPFGALHVRYLCKRLRAQFPHVKIVAAVLREDAGYANGKSDLQIPADGIGSSLKQVVAEVVALVPSLGKPVRQTALSI